MASTKSRSPTATKLSLFTSACTSDEKSKLTQIIETVIPGITIITIFKHNLYYDKGLKLTIKNSFFDLNLMSLCDTLILGNYPSKTI